MATRDILQGGTAEQATSYYVRHEVVATSGGKDVLAPIVAASGATVTANPAVPSNATSSALEKSRVIKASAGTLYGLSGYNSAAYAQYFQIHDAAAVPEDAAVPILGLVVYVGAGENFQLDFGARGRAFANGISVCTSSTLATKTLGANADASWDAQYA